MEGSQKKSGRNSRRDSGLPNNNPLAKPIDAMPNYSNSATTQTEQKLG